MHFSAVRPPHCDHAARRWASDHMDTPMPMPTSEAVMPHSICTHRISVTLKPMCVHRHHRCHRHRCRCHRYRYHRQHRRGKPQGQGAGGRWLYRPKAARVELWSELNWNSYQAAHHINTYLQKSSINQSAREDAYFILSVFQFQSFSLPFPFLFLSCPVKVK